MLKVPLEDTTQPMSHALASAKKECVFRIILLRVLYCTVVRSLVEVSPSEESSVGDFRVLVLNVVLQSRPKRRLSYVWEVFQAEITAEVSCMVFR